MNHVLRSGRVAAVLCLSSIALVVAAVLVGLGGRASDGPAIARPVLVTSPSPAATTTVHPEPAAPRHVGRPTRLLIPAIGVDERLHGVGLKADGAMETPDFGDAGWYDEGPRPGATGPAVVVAHVHGPAGDDVFARLHTLRPGDRVTVRRTDGAATFIVDVVERAPKEALPYERIWNDTGEPVLRLITCGGKPDPVTRIYPDNTIVYAHLAG